MQPRVPKQLPFHLFLAARLQDPTRYVKEVLHHCVDLPELATLIYGTRVLLHVALPLVLAELIH